MNCVTNGQCEVGLTLTFKLNLIKKRYLGMRVKSIWEKLWRERMLLSSRLVSPESPVWPVMISSTSMPASSNLSALLLPNTALMWVSLSAYFNFKLVALNWVFCRNGNPPFYFFQNDNLIIIILPFLSKMFYFLPCSCSRRFFLNTSFSDF